MNKLIFLTAIISGFSIFINKFGVSFSDPYVFAFIRNLAVGIILLGLVLALKKRKQLFEITKKQWAQLIGIGLIGGSVPFMLFFKGLQLTSSAKAGFIHKSMFVFVALFAYGFLKERHDKTFFVSALLLLAGNALLLGLAWQPLNIGDALILGATVLWAAENTLSKHVLASVQPKIVAFSRMFFGSLFILAFLALTGRVQGVLALETAQVAWALVPAGFLFLYVLTWYTGLKDTSVTKATSILLLSSPITTVINIIYSGNLVALSQLVGMVALVLGVLMMIQQDVKTWMATSW